jgi:drug/metabolite transporter (DMT)-like permease
MASTPAAVALLSLPHAAVGWTEWLLQGAFQGLVIGALSIYVYSAALARLGPQRTALMTSAVPCVTTIGAVLILHEALSPAVLLGIALVTAGTVVSLLWGRTD